ncbi:MAG TPA: hypothetical protein VM689_22165 [Aliidongia sp.]|nr:hypothetical protein [Aliidongia sp.]
MAESEDTNSPNRPDGIPLPMHVNAVLIASSRAMTNALDALGFPEEDDRLVEQDGRLGFMTCSHEVDCDDMFALITELSTRGETWEIQFRIDVEPSRAIFHVLSRHRPVAALEQELDPLEEGGETDKPSLGTHDLDTAPGGASFRREMRRIKAADVFAEIGSGRDGRAHARIVQRNPRRLLAEATAADEPALRVTLREVIPNVMFSVGRGPE